MKADEPTNEWTTEEEERIEIAYRQQIPSPPERRGPPVVRCPRDDTKLDVHLRRVPEGEHLEFPELDVFLAEFDIFLEFACPQCRRSFRMPW